MFRLYLRCDATVAEVEEMRDREVEKMQGKGIS
jgi:hypothetical protein